MARACGFKRRRTNRRRRRGDHRRGRLQHQSRHCAAARAACARGGEFDVGGAYRRRRGYACELDGGRCGALLPRHTLRAASRTGPRTARGHQPDADARSAQRHAPRGAARSGWRRSMPMVIGKSSRSASRYYAAIEKSGARWRGRSAAVICICWRGTRTPTSCASSATRRRERSGAGRWRWKRPVKRARIPACS